MVLGLPHNTESLSSSPQPIRTYKTYSRKQTNDTDAEDNNDAGFSSSGSQPPRTYQTYSRKRNNDNDIEDSSDASTVDATSTSYDKKEKWRAVAGPGQLILDKERARNLQLARQLKELKRANMLLTEAKNQSESLLEEARVSFWLKEQEVSELRSQIPAPGMDLDLSASTPGQLNGPDMTAGSLKPDDDVDDDDDDATITALENQTTQQQQTPRPTADEIAQLLREHAQAQRDKNWFEQQLQETVGNFTSGKIFSSLESPEIPPNS
ncbi:hypothetical protein C8R42DRAFT_726405 [Lentinula raphanica]|nr:hypothetical protein C8R42DRAFT_726405 [Lentinula raphanica]